MSPRPTLAPDAPQAVAALPWQRQLAQRMATLWGLKMVGTAVCIAGFFPLYFWILRQSEARAATVPLTFVDGWFSLHDWALPLYATLWLYLSLPPAFCKDWAELRRYTIVAGAMTAIALAVFLAFPTATPAPAVEWAQYPTLAFLKSVDAAGNACPSLHAAFVALTAVMLSRQLRAVGAPHGLRAANGLWALAILWSTLATGQHVLLDLLGGLLLSLAALWLERLLPGATPHGTAQAGTGTHSGPQVL